MKQVLLDRRKLEYLCDKNSKTLVETALKLSEETGEVAQAVLAFRKAHGSEYKGKGREDIVEELIDVIMVAESMLYKLNVSDNTFNTVFNNKLAKWEEKTK